MVLGSHVIIGLYGFWLPNDERGSWSDFVGSWELLRFGNATAVRVRDHLLGGPLMRQGELRDLACQITTLAGEQRLAGDGRHQ